MRECGFFEELETTKRDIGLLKDINENITDKQQVKKKKEQILEGQKYVLRKKVQR